MSRRTQRRGWAAAGTGAGCAAGSGAAAVGLDIGLAGGFRRRLCGGVFGNFGGVGLDFGVLVRHGAYTSIVSRRGSCLMPDPSCLLFGPAYGKLVSRGVTRGLIDVGPPASSMMLEISPLSSSATVIMLWKRTPGRFGHFDRARQDHVGVAEHAVNTQPPRLVMHDVIRHLVRRPAIHARRAGDSSPGRAGRRESRIDRSRCGRSRHSTAPGIPGGARRTGRRQSRCCR